MVPLAQGYFTHIAIGGKGTGKEGVAVGQYRLGEEGWEKRRPQARKQAESGRPCPADSHQGEEGDSRDQAVLGFPFREDEINLPQQ